MLKQGGGVMLNLASIASLIGLTDRFAYSMSKGAVLTMTRSIAVDFIKQGIRCNCVCPARVHTPFVDGYLRDNYPGREQEMYQTLSEYQPIGRMGEPHEVAALALYLCSDEASFITGPGVPDRRRRAGVLGRTTEAERHGGIEEARVRRTHAEPVILRPQPKNLLRWRH